MKLAQQFIENSPRLWRYPPGGRLRQRDGVDHLARVEVSHGKEGGRRLLRRRRRRRRRLAARVVVEEAEVKSDEGSPVYKRVVGVHILYLRECVYVRGRNPMRARRSSRYASSVPPSLSSARSCVRPHTQQTRRVAPI